VTTSALTHSAATRPTAAACYLYALALGERSFEGFRGVADSSVEALPVDGITAVVSRADPQLIDVDIETADALGEDAPLARLIRAHDAVVRRAFEDGPVLPLRFGTFFADADRLARWVGERKPEIMRALEDVGACSEWTLRVVRDEHRTEGEAEPVATTGAAYLAARSTERRARVQRREAMAAAANQVFDAAAEHARATVETALPARLPGDRSCAYLVAAQDEDRFIESIAHARASLIQLGVDVDVAGPWPPYHFVSLPAVGDG
jgi:hypothetical protein